MTYPPQPPPNNDWGSQPYGYGQQPGGYPDQGWAQPPDSYGYGPVDPNAGPPAYDPNSAPPAYDPNSAPPMSAAPASGQAWQQQQPFMQQPPPPPPQSKTPVWLFVVAGVVVLLTVVASGFFLMNLGGGSGEEPQASQSADSADPETSSSESSSDTVEPEGFITDESTGLSYEKIGSPWTESTSLKLVAGTGATYGEHYKVEEMWIAQFAIGEIDGDKLGYESLDSMEDSLAELADMVDEANYSYDGQSLDGLQRASEPEFTEVTVAGWDGMVVGYTLEWDDSSLQESTEYVFLGILDDGSGKLAGFQVALPGSIYDEQEEAVKTALDSFEFQ